MKAHEEHLHCGWPAFPHCDIMPELCNCKNEELDEEEIIGHK